MDMRSTFRQATDSIPLRRISRKRKVEMGNPSHSKVRIYPIMINPIASVFFQRKPFQKSESFLSSLFFRDWTNMIMAIRLMKVPANMGKKPGPGSRVVPRPSEMELLMAHSPMANQIMEVKRSAFNLSVSELHSSAKNGIYIFLVLMHHHNTFHPPVFPGSHGEVDGN
jgi:hypothetical protein